MAGNARERLAELLGGSKPTGAFSVQFEAPAHGLGLEVAGVGQLSLPLRAPQAKKLIAVARPALFGRGEETLSDTSVRDTWQISPDQITLAGPSWPTLLNGALEHFRDELGLPATARLRAEPHTLLVYGKGQFFLPHQDSEKDDAMVGTLVLSLPSAHTGGELVIEHAGRRSTYRASRTELTLVAFYADCRHEVTPVRSGYRVTLTFNLLAKPGTSAQDTGPLAELAHCLDQHFSTPARQRYATRDLDPPNRLVYLLDHEYTQRGLSWERLKGADAERAALLRAAAGQAGCESVLALAEVKQTWDAYPADDAPWDDYYGYDEEGEDEDDGPATDDYVVQDLIDDEITLDWWTGPDGAGGEPISLYVHDYEACASTPSTNLTPYEAQYEGYMGNYGNTLDRWYRRAAVVVWPRERAFAACGEAGSRWALEELRNRIEQGDPDGARTAAHSLAPFWKHTVAQPELLDCALHVAAGLGAAETAAMLLEPFQVGALGPEHAGGLAAAAERYGTAWLRQVVDGWFGPRNRYEPHRHEWTERLPDLCTALRATGPGTAAERLLFAGAWTAVAGDLLPSSTTGPAETRRSQLEALALPLQRILQAADQEQRAEILTALRAQADTVLECLMPMLRCSAQALPTDARRTAGLDALARDCADRLRAIAARQPRAADDWSIAWTGCGCELCAALETFLGSRSRRVLEWPLAKDGRRHVHTKIDSARLPVHHQTRRQGRPYTLVLTKTEQLFIREQSARHQAEADLTWLTSAWNA
ncbi:2OG-Fe(II) oxygenase [Streptomyces sp. CB01881]|uniref:2OG-Fe(II) oxygenase n=1 Tax=Streptomyces sp. CB01881 TaxID=2078691 RepID=UPI000CDBF6A8|nr:2OG-Fe(II) oxygenase [Streptomyces sp. CB01881]AUY48309.1 2OG-Fe(II) oxygenase [Streptomyces sp. CB01881]TYC76797.1 2OG-Fe(II) oxygenase [Streptomyces sp. CB01881]